MNHYLSKFYKVFVPPNMVNIKMFFYLRRFLVSYMYPTNDVATSHSDLFAFRCRFSAQLPFLQKIVSYRNVENIPSRRIV